MRGLKINADEITAKLNLGHPGSIAVIKPILDELNLFKLIDRYVLVERENHGIFHGTAIEEV